ncbi:shikimate kinase [Bacillus sp. FSL K6-3431]|uniref:shikimate kinase n=1 Tax=Bacillus sp. FSL K6-3431 TaxID=2921500 RepID=UPI0030F9685C
MTRAIYLIGFMGAGKTEIGKVLGEKSGSEVIDMDERIVKEAGMQISDMFNRYGEVYFREKESQVLKVIGKDSTIVTTGGGVILKEENRGFLKEKGMVVFLQCRPEVIVNRLKDDLTRPLIRQKSLADIVDMYNARLPLYLECADIVIDTTNLTIEEAASLIKERIKLGSKGNTSY